MPAGTLGLRPGPSFAATDSLRITLYGAGGHGSGLQEVARIVAGLPSNHSPLYAPVEDPTIGVGVGALSAAAREWLAATRK
jgi:hypothetical protein